MVDVSIFDVRLWSRSGARGEVTHVQMARGHAGLKAMLQVTATILPPNEDVGYKEAESRSTTSTLSVRGHWGVLI